VKKKCLKWYMTIKTGKKLLHDFFINPMADYGSQPKTHHINMVMRPMADIIGVGVSQPMVDIIGVAAYGSWHKICHAMTARRHHGDNRQH
jgi:hypothetical protein